MSTPRTHALTHERKPKRLRLRPTTQMRLRRGRLDGGWATSALAAPGAEGGGAGGGGGGGVSAAGDAWTAAVAKWCATRAGDGAGGGGGGGGGGGDAGEDAAMERVDDAGAPPAGPSASVAILPLASWCARPRVRVADPHSAAPPAGDASTAITQPWRVQHGGGGGNARGASLGAALHHGSQGLQVASLQVPALPSADLARLVRRNPGRCACAWCGGCAVHTWACCSTVVLAAALVVCCCCQSTPAWCSVRGALSCTHTLAVSPPPFYCIRTRTHTCTHTCTHPNQPTTHPPTRVRVDLLMRGRLVLSCCSRDRARCHTHVRGASACRAHAAPGARLPPSGAAPVHPAARSRRCRCHCRCRWGGANAGGHQRCRSVCGVVQEQPNTCTTGTGGCRGRHCVVPQP